MHRIVENNIFISWSMHSSLSFSIAILQIRDLLVQMACLEVSLVWLCQVTRDRRQVSPIIPITITNQSVANHLILIDLSGRQSIQIALDWCVLSFDWLISERGLYIPGRERTTSVTTETSLSAYTFQTTIIRTQYY